MLRTNRPLCLAIALALSAPALAETALADAGAEPAERLERITVSASTSRTPESDAALPNTITVITAEDLRQQLTFTNDLSVVLANLVPAFAPGRQKMTSFGESLRGRQPLYLVDGVPQSTPLRDGSRDAHTIDPAFIDRVEIIHGSNALHGLGGSGGIINIITKAAPGEDGTFHDVSVNANTALPDRADGSGWRAAYLFGARSGDVDFVGGASYARQGMYYDANGRRIAVNNVQGDLMDAAGNNLYAKLGWNLAPGQRLQATINRYDLEGDGDYVSVPGDYRAGRPATSIKGPPLAQPPRNRSDSLNLDYSAKIAGGDALAQLFFVDYKGRFGGTLYRNFFGNDPNATWIDQSQNVSQKTGGKFSYSRGDVGGVPLRLTFGLDLIRDRTYQRMIVSDLDWVPKTTYESVSPLVQAEYWIGENVMLAGGLRHESGKLKVGDYVTLPQYGAQHVAGGEPSMRDTLPNLGVVWHVTDALNVYASYAEGYNVADVGRILRAIDRPGQRVDDLVDLTPVVSDNREIGIEYDDSRWIGQLAAYWSASDLGSILVYDPAAQVYNVQRQATKIKGLEASAGLRFGDGHKVGVAYARADGQYASRPDGEPDTDLQGINIAPNRLNAYWEQRWADDLSTRLQASKNYDRGFDNAAGNRIAAFRGYTTVDLYARYALPVGALSVGVENVTNRQYVSYYSQTTPSNADYASGRGRTLSVGWSHRF